MDLRNGPPSDYHRPPFESKVAQPDRDNTHQQQELASHGAANAVIGQGHNATEEQKGSEKAIKNKVENVQEDVGATDGAVDGYLDKKMGGANF
jgi:hypothetical protein